MSDQKPQGSQQEQSNALTVVVLPFNTWREIERELRERGCWWLANMLVNTQASPFQQPSDHKCPDCGGPLGYVPDDPAQVCQKCFDDFDGLTIDELFDEPSQQDSKP